MDVEIDDTLGTLITNSAAIFRFPEHRNDLNLVTTSSHSQEYIPHT